MPKKTTHQPIVVLFEDDETRRNNYRQCLQKALGKGVEIVAVEDERNLLPKRTDELHQLDRRLLETFQSSRFKHGNIGLIVCDMALDRYEEAGVPSATIVASTAQMLGIPICLYEEGNSSANSLMRLRNWEKGAIVVESTGDDFGRECTGLYHGFVAIAAALDAIPPSEFKKLTPPDILARVLDKPEETDRIALYGLGEQSFLTELAPYLDGEDVSLPELKKRYSRILGNWLYTSILRFPGILVNAVAASSFLNIKTESFEKKESISNLFKRAKYQGPFSSIDEWWWRRDLESIVCDGQSETGLEYAKKMGLKGLRSCRCEDKEADGKHDAGYYCMLTRKPVCEKHSHGGISWFPSGADLSRVSSSLYSKYGPFMGMY